MTLELELLHEKALSLAHRFRSVETELLEVLIEVENIRGYLPLGYDSLFSYCEGYLKLTRDQSYAFMAIARKSKDVPELKIAVQEQKITFSNARKLVPVLNSENKDLWLEKGESLSQRALEKEIAKVSPRTVVENIKPVSREEAELRVGLDEEMEKNLSRIKALLKTGSAKEALKALMEDFLKRHDPVEKARRERKTTATPVTSAKPVGVRRNIARRYIPKEVFHEVQRRDAGKCQFKGLDGKLCGNSFGVHIHHLEPWAYGGRHTKENLMTLCHAHHAYWHHSQLPTRTAPGRGSAGETRRREACKN